MLDRPEPKGFGPLSFNLQRLQTKNHLPSSTPGQDTHGTTCSHEHPYKPRPNHVAPLMWDPSETTHLSRRKMWPDRRDGLCRLSLIVMNETVVECALHGASFYLMSPKEDFQASLCSTGYMARLQDSQPRLQLESSLDTIPKFAV